MKKFFVTTAATLLLALAVSFGSASADSTVKSVGYSDGKTTGDDIAEAKKWLGYARDRFSNNESNIVYCRQYLAKAGMKPAEIGTSEKEFSQLLHDGYIAEAKKWLGYARRIDGSNLHKIEYCLSALEKAQSLDEANVSLQSIGTSPQEIRKLLILGEVAEAIE